MHLGLGHACGPSMLVCLASNYSHGLTTQTLLPTALIIMHIRSYIAISSTCMDLEIHACIDYPSAYTIY